MSRVMSWPNALGSGLVLAVRFALNDLGAKFELVCKLFLYTIQELFTPIVTLLVLGKAPQILT